MTRLPDLIQKELDACGLPWELVQGRRHIKLFVAGRMVTTLSHNQDQGSYRNLVTKRADIRRAVFAAKGGRQ